MHKRIAIMFIAALLAGCSDSKPPQKTVFDPQIEAMKKARGVEQKLEAAAQRQRENVERQSGEK